MLNPLKMKYWALILLLVPSVACAQFKCDSVTDDGPAIQAAFNACQTVQLPSHKGLCRTNEPLTATTCAGFQGNGSYLDASAVSGIALTVSSTQQGSNYWGNEAPWENLNIQGSGSGTGLLVKASNWSVHGLNIHGFANAIQFGNNAFVDRFYDSQLWNNDTNVSYPAGLTDSGEQLSFIGGTWFNSNYGLRNSGGEFNLTDLSIDAMTKTPISGWGVVRLTNAHIEKFSSVPIINYGSNAYSHITIADTDFLSDGNYNLPLVQNNGGYIQGTHIFLSGFSNFSGLVSGTASSKVSLCGITNGSGGGSIDNMANVGNCP